MNSLIISLNFNPGHVSHLVASYRQCEDLGYNSVYYVAREFISYLPQNSNIIESFKATPKADLAIFLFPSQNNLPLIWNLKRKGCKIIYIFHEPLAPMKIYKDAGFSIKYLAKLWIINHISALTIKWSDIILLPSKKAVSYYNKNKLYKNPNYHYLPLMYADEREKEITPMSRKYFSYIGTIAADHSFIEYLDFVKWAIKNNKLPNLHFLIATKSDFEVPEILRNNIRVKIQKGRPMTDQEINDFYGNTYVIWNAYARTTQSGVLAKSFMFGTPALVLRNNLNEFTHENENVIAIDDNTDYIQIHSALSKILNNYMHFSVNARKEFEKSFYYKQYNERMKKIINI